MTDPTITEVLPEGDHAAWITLNDGQTRLLDLEPLLALPSHHALRLPRLARQPRRSLDGRRVQWPGGALLDVASIHDAPDGRLPLRLLALMPEAARYRPVLALLKHAGPPTPEYLDVRPPDVLRSRLGLTMNELASILDWHRPAPPTCVLARLSDLLLLLTLVVPQSTLPLLLRQPWPHAQRCDPTLQPPASALDCLRHGRIDLIEAPLTHLLLPAWPQSAAQTRT